MEFPPREQLQGFLATPEICAEETFFGYPVFRASLSLTLDDLPEISPPGATVLGKRMEHFFACYISHFTSEEVLIQNQQIIQNKVTLGELDFLLRDSASEIYSHIELIYKFYLFDPETGTSELDHLIGPNKRDSLNRKLSRLETRQFPLLFHPATTRMLKTLKVDPQNISQKMCFKASVFLPKHMEKYSFTLINPEAVAGFWIKASEFTMEGYGKNTFFIPQKKYWPVLPEHNHIWFSFKEIVAQIQPLLKNNFAPLIWMKGTNGNYERLFVVWW